MQSLAGCHSRANAQEVVQNDIVRLSMVHNGVGGQLHWLDHRMIGAGSRLVNLPNAGSELTCFDALVRLFPGKQ